MKRVLFIFVLMVFATSIFAQKGAIKGSVLDAHGNYLPFANILVKGTAKGTVSEMNGDYVLSGVKTGKQTLVVSYIGYKDVEMEVEVTDAKTTVVNLILSEEMMLEEVIVNSRLEGQSKATNSQKNSINITSVVADEQLDRFPDANIGDALKRLNGVNVQYDQGEARFGNIRGTAPELNAITINGERVPSAEAEIRSVQLDLIPADMIQMVYLTKAITPDMDPDAIGGSVNLVTKSAPYGMQITGKLGSGYNFVSSKPIYKGSLVLSNRFFDDKFGIVVGASWHDNNLGSDNIEAEWDYVDENENEKFDDGEDVFATNFQQRQYYIQRFRQSYSAALDFKIADNHTLYFNSIYTKRNDWENRYRYEFKDIEWDSDENAYVAELRRQLKFGVEDTKYSRLEDQRMMSFSLGGDHLFGKLKTDWLVAYSAASEERPNERYLTYRAKDVLFDADFSDMSQPVMTLREPELYGNFTEEFGLKELTEQYQWTDEKDMNARLNFELPLVEGEYANILKFGVRYKGKEKQRDNWLKEYSPTEAYEDQFDALVLDNLTDVSKDNFMAGDYTMGNFPDREISDKFDLENEANFEGELATAEEAGDFNATETVTAGYMMLTQNLGSKMTILAGVRFEQTKLEYQGNIFNEDEGTVTVSELMKSDYINVLPGIHFKYSPVENSNIRLAWTNTMSRPNYYDLVPYQEINEDNEIKLGNPELVPTTSMNLDLIGEFYFKSLGLVSAGVFYKDLKDVVAYESHLDYTYNGNTYDKYLKPMNIGDASLFGFEVNLQRKLDFLPSFLKKLNVYGNYTFAQSKLENIIFEGREDEDLPMGGSPKHTYNLSLAYDTKTIEARISFNHASAFLNVNDDGGFGEQAFFDFYYNKVNYLDFNLDYKINDNFKVYFNANNLLNQPLSTYWNDSERIAQSEYYGIKLNVGLKFKF